MTSFLKQNNTITPTQFGFRHNHSTLHPILDLITNYLNNIHNKQCCALVFLDIKKAFDSVSHEKLIKKLDHYGIRGIADCRLSSYLDNRKQYVSFNNINSSTENIECGVPQGFILGPLLFLIYINDLPSCLKTDPRFFANDTALLIDGKNFADVESVTNSELSHISRWMIANSLTVNPKKTLALLISPQLRNDCSSPQVTLPVTLNSEMINTTETARYLGIIIDSKLKFQSHISLLEKKLARSVGILTKLSHFLPQQAFLNLYYFLIHSQLLYALAVW